VNVGTTGPVNISVDDEIRCRGVVKKQVVVEGALEIPKDALHGREIGLTGGVHVEAHLLDRVGNVGHGEGEVLESPSHAAVGSRVADGGPMLEETLARVSTDMEQGFVVAHASTLKDAPSILALVEEEVVEPLLY
jgi:hypothetical protein